MSDVNEAYVADSESSSIRALNLKTGGSRLLAGGDPVFSDNLFKVYLFCTMVSHVNWSRRVRF